MFFIFLFSSRHLLLTSHSLPRVLNKISLHFRHKAWLSTYGWFPLQWDTLLFLFLPRDVSLSSLGPHLWSHTGNWLEERFRVTRLSTKFTPEAWLESFSFISIWAQGLAMEFNETTKDPCTVKYKVEGSFFKIINMWKSYSCQSQQWEWGQWPSQVIFFWIQIRWNFKVVWLSFFVDNKLVLRAFTKTDNQTNKKQCFHSQAAELPRLCN